MKDIRERAVLVQFTDRVWRANIADQKVSNEVADQKEAQNKKVGTYRKSLISKSALKYRKSIGTEARTFHYENTLPWSDGGFRILPAKNIANYMKNMRDFKKKAEQAEAEFFASYDTHKEEARKILGKLFDEEDYPPLSEVQDKFVLGVTTFPIPEIKDWRVDIDQKEMDAMKKEAVDNITKLQKAAVMDLWQRLYEVVDHLQEKLSNDEGIFRDSLVGNINKILEALPALNIMDDADLNKVATEVKSKLVKTTPAVLRENPAERKKIHKDAQAIIKKMDMFMKKGGAK
jgi:hypothetical protein